MKTVVRLFAAVCLLATKPLGATILNFGSVIVLKDGYGELVRSGFDALNRDEISISGYQNEAGNPPEPTDESTGGQAATADENPTFVPLALGLTLLALPLPLRRRERPQKN
jgi:MYXO-CTERM domain-containing protein